MYSKKKMPPKAGAPRRPSFKDASLKGLVDKGKPKEAEKKDKDLSTSTFTVTLSFTRAEKPTPADEAFAKHVLQTGFGLGEKDFWSVFTPNTKGDAEKDGLAWVFRFQAKDAASVLHALKPHMEAPERFVVKISNIPGVQTLF